MCRLLFISVCVPFLLVVGGVGSARSAAPSSPENRTPTTSSAQEAEARASSVFNLKQIALPLLNYHDENKHFPLLASHSADGKPLLSWRVQILPFVEHGPALYKQFHLDEPWDSVHNRTLIDSMPSVYRLPISKAEKGRTNYLLPVGNGAVFDADNPTRLKNEDGWWRTIMVVEVDDIHAVIWTKPDDWPFDPKNPAKGLGRFFDGGFNTISCNATVRHFDWPKSPKDITTLRALFTGAGHETIEP